MTRDIKELKREVRKNLSEIQKLDQKVSVLSRRKNSIYLQIKELRRERAKAKRKRHTLLFGLGRTKAKTKGCEMMEERIDPKDIWYNVRCKLDQDRPYYLSKWVLFRWYCSECNLSKTEKRTSFLAAKLGGQSNAK